MARYKKYSREQSVFIPVCFEDQIIPGTFVHAIDHLVENELDLSIFDKHFNNDKTGATAYSPSVLLKIVLYAYSLGIVSSRKIAWCCETNITFMALSGESKPHFTTIAHFISSMKDEISELFTRVVVICSMEGLIDKKMFAIDGCKISSNASKEWSGTREDFVRKKNKIQRSIDFILDKHKTDDNADEDCHDMRAKEEKAIENLTQKANKIQAWLDENDDKIGLRGKPIQSNITDNDSAKMATSHGVIQGYNGITAADSKHQIVVHAEAHGSSTEHVYLKGMLEGARETMRQTDGHEDIYKEAVFTADTGFHSKEALEFIEDNEIDAYIPDNQFRQRDPRFDTADRHKKPVDRKGTVKKAKYFKAQEFTRDGENENLICPEGKALRIRCRNYKNKKGHIGITYVSDKEDCCCCPQKGKCIRGKKAEVRQVTIIENTMRKTDSPVRRMMEKVDSPDGKFLYSRRMGAIEPVFANIRNCLGLDRFTLRGQIKVDIQWKLFNMVHNIGKLSRFAWS